MTKIRKCRERTGKTIREVVADLGVRERTYIRWEQGHALPDAGNLVRLADYYGVHPRELVTGGR